MEARPRRPGPGIHDAAGRGSGDEGRNAFRIVGPRRQSALEKASAVDRIIDDLAADPKEVWGNMVRGGATDRLARHLVDFSWQFLVSESLQFLTGDDPVYYHRHEGIGAPLAEVSFPISSSVALLARRQRYPEGYVRASPSFVREINRRTISSAKRFVFARTEEAWIAKLVMRRDFALNRLR